MGFSFALTKNSLVLTEKKKMVLKHVHHLCSQAMSVKGSEVCQILPIITFLCCSSFPVLLFSYYFRRFRYSERGIKSLRLEVTFDKILHSFLFC